LEEWEKEIIKPLWIEPQDWSNVTYEIHQALMENREAFYTNPGEIWLDTDGNPINAHGGGFLFHEGTYYWYGEIKEGETYMPECNKSWSGTRVEVTGISCYSSKDFTNWKYEGNVLPAVKNDPNHDLHTSKVPERPKVVYNAGTNKFVLWMTMGKPIIFILLK